jgi:hypothetical protein
VAVANKKPLLHQKLDSLYSWNRRAALVKAMAVWPEGKLKLSDWSGLSSLSDVCRADDGCE